MYFLFNLNYSKSSEGLFYLTNQSVTVPAKVSITLIILISALGLFLAHAGKKLNRQRWVLIILSAVSFLVMGMPACITYFFIVFVPLYTPAFGVVSELLCSLMPDEKSTTQIIGIMAVMLPIFLGMQLYMAKYFQIGKTEKEIALEAFEEKCPDASCLYFDFPCAVGFYEHCPKTPDFRMFYKPPITTEDFRQEHLDAVRNRLPDTIVYWSEGNETKDSNRCRFIEENGYVLYGVYHDDYTVEYFYVRDDLPIA